MTTLIDSLGSQIACSSSRETIMYQSTVFPQSLPLAMSLLSSTILHPLLLPEELAAQKDAAAYEIREIWAKPELILPEVFHTVAFRSNTLGMPLLCPESQLDVLDEGSLRSHMGDWYKPERMVVAGVGMEHSQLVDLAHEHFGGLKTSATSRGSRDLKIPTPLGKPYATVSSAPIGVSEDFANLANARAVYTGGEEYIEKPDEEFVHLYIGFEGLGIHDPDIVCRMVVCLISALIAVRAGDAADAIGRRWEFLGRSVLPSAQRNLLTSRWTWERDVHPTLHLGSQPIPRSRLLCGLPSLLQRFRALRDCRQCLSEFRRLCGGCHCPAIASAYRAHGRRHHGGGSEACEEYAQEHTGHGARKQVDRCRG